MTFNGAFKDLKFNRREAFQQWDKLLLHETRFGSKTFYLLYCGETPRTLSADPTRSDCLGIPSIEELGLGIVETNVVANVRENVINQSQQFYIDYIFPNHIDSLRKLFCCSSHLQPSIQNFKKEDIETFGYRRIYLDEAKTFDDNIDGQNYELPEGGAQVRIILSNK